MAPVPDLRRLLLGTEITREQILRRAGSWLRPSVPYSQTGFHRNEYGIYRADCSGYISMAWGIPGRPANRHGGLDTVGLAAASFPIFKEELLPGDALLRTEGTNLTRHVTLFEKWATGEETHYWGFEQAGFRGTCHRIFSYPYEKATALYAPFRYIRIKKQESK